MAAAYEAKKFVGVIWWPLRGALVGMAGAALYEYTPALVVALFFAAAAFALRDPRVPGVAGLGVSVVSFVALWQLLPPRGSDHWVELLIASQTLPRSAMAALAWISRPSANAPEYFRNITTAGALLAIAPGILAAALTGWPALLLLAAMLVVLRVAQAWSYQASGGVNAASLGWVRHTLEIAVLLIARLPIAFLYSGGH
ncbi:MAG: hypothetical protein ABI811_02025 [Acidobacteriota bacterium]